MRYQHLRFLKRGARGFLLAALLCVLSRAALADDATTQVRQVRVEVRVLEWKLDNSMDFDFAVLFTPFPENAGNVIDSIDLTLPPTPSLSSAARLFLTGLDTGNGSFDAVIETLETAGDIEVLTQSAVIVPVVAKDATAATAAYDGQVISSSRIPYETVKAFAGSQLASTTEYQNTGVTFQCNAMDIRYEEFVVLAINASVKNLTDFISVGVKFDPETEDNAPLLVPVTNTRTIANQVLVRDNSILIAGLLKSSKDIERRKGIPWISELPILKWFLSNVKIDSEVTELVFLVRTEILDPVDIPS